MVRQSVIIKNTTGFQLRPAGVLCRTAMQYSSQVSFSFKNTVANAKSVLSVLGACVKCGDTIEIICLGDDEEEALKGVVKAIEDGLGE